MVSFARLHRPIHSSFHKWIDEIIFLPRPRQIGRRVRPNGIENLFFPSDVQRIKFSEIQFLLFDFSGSPDVTIGTATLYRTSHWPIWVLQTTYIVDNGFTFSSACWNWRLVLSSIYSLKFQHSFGDRKFDPIASASQDGESELWKQEHKGVCFWLCGVCHRSIESDTTLWHFHIFTWTQHICAWIHNEAHRPAIDEHNLEIFSFFFFFFH